MDDLELMELTADQLIETYEVIEAFLLKLDKEINSMEGKKK